MDSAARRDLIAELQRSEERLQAVVEGVTLQQAAFREAPDRWSILEIVEHVVVFERFIRAVVADALTRPPVEADTSAKDSLVASLATSRDRKISSREVNRPTGRFASLGEAAEAFHSARAETIAFVGTLSVDPRRHTFPHVAFGELDGAQWLLLLATHLDRHVAQIKEVKAARDYPAA